MKDAKANLEEGKTHVGAKANYLETNYLLKKESLGYDYQLINHVLKLIRTKSRGNMLDLACGFGSFKPVFESFGFSYSGVDIDYSNEASNILRCNIGGERLPFAGDRFEIIFFKMGIEHLTLPEISFCLSEAKRVLKPNGKLVILTPDWRWTYKMFYEEYTHQTPFMETSLNTALKMSGFQCDYCKTFIQLPIVWRFPFLSLLCNVAALLYPIAKKKIKFIKFSQERPLLAIATKAEPAIPL